MKKNMTFGIQAAKAGANTPFTPKALPIWVKST